VLGDDASIWLGVQHRRGGIEGTPFDPYPYVLAKATTMTLITEQPANPKTSSSCPHSKYTSETTDNDRTRSPRLARHARSNSRHMPTTALTRDPRTTSDQRQ